MPDIVMRFYGRFVFAGLNDGGANGGATLRILALNVTFNGAVNASPHKLLLVAPRRTIALDDTTLSADVVIMQPGEDPDRAELALWELAGRRMTPRVTGGFRWSSPPTAPDPTTGIALADLNMLSGGGSVEPQHLQQIGGNHPVIAVMDVMAGIGNLGLVDPAPSRFMPLRTADPAAAGPFNLKLAEFVDVTLRVPEKAPKLTIDVVSPDGASHTVTFLTNAADPTMITFSNLCAMGHTFVDEEFAASYEVLQTPPAVPDRPVPVNSPALGLVFNCFKAAFVRTDD